MNIGKELADLEKLGMNDLRARYAAVFRETTNAGNRQFLVKRILWRLQSQAEGSLSERALRRAEEIADEGYLRTTVPRLPARDTAEPAVVYAAPFRTGQQAYLPPAGTMITRMYKGRAIRVTVLENGFDYEGERFTSLSAIAKAVTGSHWNGRLFFGLAKEEENHDAD